MQLEPIPNVPLSPPPLSYSIVYSPPLCPPFWWPRTRGERTPLPKETPLDCCSVITPALGCMWSRKELDILKKWECQSYKYKNYTWLLAFTCFNLGNFSYPFLSREVPVWGLTHHHLSTPSLMFLTLQWSHIRIREFGIKWQVTAQGLLFTFQGVCPPHAQMPSPRPLFIHKPLYTWVTFSQRQQQFPMHDKLVLETLCKCIQQRGHILRIFMLQMYVTLCVH